MQEISKELAAISLEREEKAYKAKVERIGKLVKSIMADGEEYAMEVFAELGKALGYEMHAEEQVEQVAEMLKDGTNG